MQGYFESKEFRQLLGSYETAQQQGTSLFLDSEQLTDIAEYYHWMGRTNDAIDVIDYALDIYEGATAPLVLKARITLLSLDDAEEAMSLAEQIEDKSDFDYYYIKAEILIAVNKANEADLFLETCLDQIMKSETTDFMLDTATLFADYEQTALARKWLDRIEDKDMADYRETLGRVCYFEHQYEESIRLFEGLIDDNPYSTYYWDMLACVHLAMDNASEAITSSEYAIAISPDDEDALLYKAQALMRLKNYDAAIEFFDRYSQVRPCNIDGWLNAGLCHVLINRYKEGIACLLEAETKSEQYNSDRLMEIYQELVFAYSHEHTIDKALEYVSKMEELYGCDKDDTMVLRGHVFMENDMQEKAQQCYQKAIDNSLCSPTILLRVAISLYDNNFLDIAYSILQGMTSIDRRSLPQTYAYLAVCAYDLDMREDYLTYLSMAAEYDPATAKDVLEHLFPDGMQPQDYYDYAKMNHLKI